MKLALILFAVSFTTSLLANTITRADFGFTQVTFDDSWGYVLDPDFISKDCEDDFVAYDWWYSPQTDYGTSYNRLIRRQNEW